MKRPIHSYVLNPGAGTLDLSGIAGFDVRNLFAVIHLPTGTLIYAPTALQGYSAIAGSVLTLKVSVAAMGSTDPLLVLYDDGGKPAEDTSVQAVSTALGGVLTISGTSAVGSAPANPPLSVSGVDGGGLKRHLLTDAGGIMQVGGTPLSTLATNSPTLGQKASAGSVPVVLSTDGPFTTNFGTQGDSAATSDAGSFSLIALVKRLLGKIPGFGQALSSASLPVVIASDQSLLATRPVPFSGTGGFSGAVVGTSVAPALAARTGTQHDLTLRNESTAATIAVAFGATPAFNTAGSFTLGPGDSLTWAASYVPLDAINAIASASGTPLTIGSH